MDVEPRASEPLGGPPVDRDDASAGFFDAAADGRLAVRGCVTGDGLFAPEVARCPDCGAATEWITVSGRGRLVTEPIVMNPVPFPYEFQLFEASARSANAEPAAA